LEPADIPPFTPPERRPRYSREETEAEAELAKAKAATTTAMNCILWCLVSMNVD